MSDVETRSGTGALGVAAGFLGGALVGAVLALLLAPRSGRETRERMREQAKRSRDALEHIGTVAKRAASVAGAAVTTALHDERTP